MNTAISRIVLKLLGGEVLRSNIYINIVWLVRSASPRFAILNCNCKQLKCFPAKLPRNLFVFAQRRVRYSQGVFASAYFIQIQLSTKNLRLTLSA